jgi:electron transfer flavoprotein alpha subunit
MTARVFAYIRHTNGLVDDTAVQLASVAKKIDAASPLTAVIAGFGPDFDKACESLRAIYQEVWKIPGAAFVHPSPELLAKVLVRVLPEESVVLLAHDSFGMDVGPGLSIVLNSVYVADVIGIDHLERTNLRVVCQEFGGQLNTHVNCDISSGVVITVRPGAFKPSETVPLSGLIL